MIVCAEAIDTEVPSTDDPKDVDGGDVLAADIPPGQSAGVGNPAADSAAAPSLLDGQVGSKEIPEQPLETHAETLGDSIICTSFYFCSNRFLNLNI
jgi:hypothetical protein